MSKQEQIGGNHYKDMKIQPFEYIHANGIPFAEGCVIKYVSRWRSKGGIEDLRKARHFLDLLIEAEGGPADAREDDAAGWMLWSGNLNCGPLAGMPGAMVRVRLRDGYESNPGLAKSFRWDHRQVMSDIVAYKVISDPSAQ